jgi:hypothetical protein
MMLRHDMRDMKTAVCVSFFLCFCTVGGQSQAQTNRVPAEAPNPIDASFARAYRVRQARQILEKVQPICDAVPNPTPAEKDWSASELQRIGKLSGDQQKRDAARWALSREGRLERSKTTLLDLVSGLTQVINGSQEEFSEWIPVCSHLLMSNGLIEDLEWLAERNHVSLSKGELEDLQSWQILGQRALLFTVWPNVRRMEKELADAKTHLEPVPTPGVKPAPKAGLQPVPVR